MRKRTLSREIALQLLYQLEIRGDEIINEIDSFCKEQGKEPDISDFAMTLVHGCIQIMKEIDKKISSTSERWDLHRMPIIDRNILRLACYELLYMDDIPHKVSINEAIDLAKKYSTKKSGLFVNGVLDKVYSHYVKKNEEDRNRTSNLKKDNSLKTNRRTGADLHIHTEYSDGTMSPEQVVDAASKLNLRTIAITDHDNIEAVEIAQDICDKEGMTLVPAVELSSYHSPSDIHILGYFIDLKNNALLGKLSELHIERVERIKKITNKLKGLDVFIDPQEVFDVSGKGAPGRMHIAEVLCKKGYCYNIQECFQKYLSDDGPAYEPKVTLTLEGAIEVIMTSGGVPVLAHPNSTRRDDLIPKMVEYGLQGIEVYYHTHQPDVVRKYESLAREYDLIATGGSDFHGERRPDIELGCITIDDNTVEKIKERHNNVLGMLSCK